MSFQFRIRLICLSFLFFASLLMTTIPGQAAEGCFIERGRTQMVNITKVAVSGHLVTSLQRGSWDTRPAVRVAEIRPHGVFLIDIEDPVNPRRIDHFEDIGLGPQDLATAWPSIAASNVDSGIGILGLHRSCQPPRHSTDRVVP